jgi:hypothetical protein
MIGEAIIKEQTVDGNNTTVVVPSGKTTQKDPTTGEIVLTPISIPNSVNEVVQAIAGSAPDASDRSSSDLGCSKGKNALRPVAKPVYDEAIATQIAQQLKALSPGELLMVMAVMINNANHLCIDTATIASTVGLVATVRPEEAGNVVFVAALLDSDNTERYTDAALAAAPDSFEDIERGRDDAEKLDNNFSDPLPPLGTPDSQPPVNTNPPRDVPPGGAIGEPPSPE